MLLGAWSKLPRLSGIPRDDKPEEGRHCLFAERGEVGVRQNIAPPPSYSQFIRSFSATFLLGTDFTAEFTSLTFQA